MRTGTEMRLQWELSGKYRCHQMGATDRGGQEKGKQQYQNHKGGDGGGRGLNGQGGAAEAE